MQSLRAQRDTVNLPGVQVSSKIERDTVIKLNRLTDLSSVVSDLQVRSYGLGQVSTISIDGLAARHTRVFVDGVNMVPSYLGVVDFSVFPMYLFGRLMVKRGFDDVRSTGGFGGLLGFELLWPDSSFVESVLGFGSFGNSFFSQELGYSQGKVKVILKSFTRQGKNDFLFENEYLPGRPLQRMKNSDFSQRANLAGVSYRFNERLWGRAWAVFNNVFRHFPPPVSYQGVERVEFQSVFQGFGGINLNYRIGLRTVARFFVGGNGQNLFYGLDFNGLNALSSSTRFASLQSNVVLQSTNIQAGIRSQIDDYSNILRQTQTTFLNARRFEAIYYLQYVRSFKRSDLSLFSELIQVERKFYQAFSSKFSVGWLKVSFGRNINIPTLNDLYWRPGGNALLKPEKAYFFTVKFNKNPVVFLKTVPMFFDFEIYQKFVRDWILWKPTQYHYWQAQNLEFVWARGVVLNVKIKNLNIKKLCFSDNLSFNYRRVTDTSGKQLIYTPNLLIINNLTIKKANININLIFHYESKRYVVPGNENYVLPGYMTGDCLIGADFFKHKKIKLNFGFIVKNFTNTKYYEVIARPMPGRHFMLNLKLSF